MIREMTFGQYYEAESVIHKLDARVKLLGTILFAISVFLARNIYGIGAVTVALGFVLRLAKVPLVYYKKGIRPLIPIILFTIIINMFTVPGTVLVAWSVFTITREGLITAVYITLRLIYLIVGTSVMTYTTTPTALMDAMESIFHPLTLIRVPVHELAVMMSIALRFIPILTQELDKIMKAQLARGANFEEGNLLHRCRSLLPVLVPLLVSAIRRASDLGLAMEARCFRGGAERTRLHPLVYEKKDYIAYGSLIVYIMVIIGMRMALS